MVRELVESQVEDWKGQRLDGWQAMAATLYEIAMGRKPPGMSDSQEIRMKDRMLAIQLLIDRVYGKAKIQIEADTTVRPGALENLDVDKLSPEELDALEAHVEVLAAKVEGKATSKVLDVSPADVIELEKLDKIEEP